MEWATEIGKSSDGLVSHIVDASSLRTVPITGLISRGLPSLQSHHIVVEQDVSQWREVDSNEYLSAFGITSNTRHKNLHAVYEAVVDECRVLLPALVLMRAFFRPVKYCLPMMFSPQGLDGIRYLDVNTVPPRVELLSGRLRDPTKHGDVTTPLSWMSMFPSAMRFAASVHLSACSGRIAVTLPLAKATMALSGQLSDKVLRVTAGRLLSVHALEDPLWWAAGHTRIIYQSSQETLRQDIPHRSDGMVDVTDPEWARLEPILIRRKRKADSDGLNQRKILDGVLGKLAHGTSWRRTAYSEGKAGNAHQAYREWNLAGIWDQVLSVLREMRTGEVSVS